jgi:hypothetical protein
VFVGRNQASNHVTRVIPVRVPETSSWQSSSLPFALNHYDASLTGCWQSELVAVDYALSQTPKNWEDDHEVSKDQDTQI